MAFLPRFVQASNRTWELNRPWASARFQVSTPGRPTSVPSMTLHTSFGRRGVSALLRASTFVRFSPPPALLHLPEAWSSDHTTLL